MLKLLFEQLLCRLGLLNTYFLKDSDIKRDGDLQRSLKSRLVQHLTYYNRSDILNKEDKLHSSRENRWKVQQLLTVTYENVSNFDIFKKKNKLVEIMRPRKSISKRQLFTNWLLRAEQWKVIHLL